MFVTLITIRSCLNVGKVVIIFVVSKGFCRFFREFLFISDTIV